MKEKFVSEIQDNKGLIFKVCKMYSGSKQDQEDLFQDIVLQLWRSYPSYKGLSKISTWMYRIALNTAITRFKKEKRKEQYTELDLEALNIADQDNSEKNERIFLLKKAIQQLSDIEKAITLLYLDEYSYKDMAEIVGISESNIGFKLNVIKGKLKNILNPL